MIFDSHIHTEVSFDSEMKLTAALERARELGIGLVATEHMDLDYPEQGKFLFDARRYFDEYGPFRGDALLLGVELGMKASCAEQGRALADGEAFDYVLGSIHLVENTDLYYASFYEGRSKAETYGLYFQTMLDCLRCYPFIDALGHIDYIARYGRYEYPDVDYASFREPIDCVLRAAIERDIVLEINTRRLKDSAAVSVLLPLYRQYHSLGGCMVTLGSDAHGTADIGGNFALGEALAETCGLRIVYFKERRPVYAR